MSVTKVTRRKSGGTSIGMPPMDTGKTYRVKYEDGGESKIIEGACVKIGGPSMAVVMRDGELKTEIPYDNITGCTPIDSDVEPMPKEVENALRREGVEGEGTVLPSDFDAQYNHGKRVDIANKVHQTAKDKKVRVTYNVSVEIPFSVTSNMIVDAAEKLNIPAVKKIEFVRMEKI